MYIGVFDQSLYNITPCMDHKESPQIISTWLPEKIGSMPGKSVIFAETQVKLTNNTCHTVCSFKLIFISTKSLVKYFVIMNIKL